MCGRSACTLSENRLRRIARLNGGAKIQRAERFRAKYNLTPQSYVPVVHQTEKTADDNCRQVAIMKWGLVPSFAKEAESWSGKTFNARVEGLPTSGVWKRLIERRRCVVLFDGFYEWKTTSSKQKQPFFIRNRDDYGGHHLLPLSEEGSCGEKSDDCAGSNDGPVHAPLMLAALYDVWSSGEKAQDDCLESAAILTMDSCSPVFDIHDRMPVFLTPETAALWLDCSKSFADIIGQITQCSEKHAKTQLHLYEVPSLVSSIRNESPDCIMPKKEYDARQKAKGIGAFFKPAGASKADAHAQAQKRPAPDKPADAATDKKRKLDKDDTATTAASTGELSSLQTGACRKAGCDFFGTAATGGFCSSCFREQRQADTSTATSGSPEGVISLD
eukprot:TRINITY_DN22631_c0_g1_i1.p1 TRINITY_DN22631_c0_g1~~TRINITY_DN22631_c0_g1_i1.p1  ORF type:complete len:388 (+),score=58.02 TRINITY_DN22631_c0_g1_i1:111-1274(+)